MKKKKTAALLAALSILFTLILPAFATGTVEYSAAREIEIRTGGEKPLDLFEYYTKDLMPGAQVTFRVLVRNTSGQPVNMYLKAADPDEATYAANGADAALSKALLKEMPMRIDLIDGAAATPLFNGLSDGTSGTGTGMREFISLGTAPSGVDRFLEIRLTVPVTLDNTYQNAIGVIDWIFRVEETAEDTTELTATSPTSPTAPTAEPTTPPTAKPPTKPTAPPATKPTAGPATQPAGTTGKHAPSAGTTGQIPGPDVVIIVPP
ncbi:MAG: hypothetical protein IKD72_00900, partial [Clostridia bacterium]|nr:hypothetical protein [Clostridia bacterium]